MGRKSREKGQPASPASPPPPPSSRLPLVIAAVVLLVVGAGGYAWWGKSRADQQAAADAAAAQAAPVPQPLAEPINAKFGPHKQDNLPLLPFTGYPPPRPPEVVRAAYQFAAEHPEVLGYVPCYCGCNRQGHRGNDDCFVARRAANGDVVEWDSHGMS